jgi:hypothetical protein
VAVHLLCVDGGPGRFLRHESHPWCAQRVGSVKKIIQFCVLFLALLRTLKG